MQNEHLSKILNSATKKVEESQGVLTRLFRQVMDDINMTPYTWQRHMQRYLNDPRNRISKNSKQMSSARGNLVKELVRPDMTWKVFRKALSFLNPKSAKFTLTLEWHNGKSTVHEVVIHTSQLDVEDSELVKIPDNDNETSSGTPRPNMVTLNPLIEAVKEQVEVSKDDRSD